MVGRLASGMMTLVNKVGAFARDRRRRLATLREVNALSADGRAKLLKEVGMSHHEFTTAMRTPFISEDLNARALQVVGIDPAKFRSQHIEWSRDMQRQCMICTARSRCRRDLDADIFGRQYRHYCSNAKSLSEFVASGGRVPGDGMRSAEPSA